MSHKPAKCCETCQHATETGGCKTNYASCERWRVWFRKEWARIRQAAAIIKKNNERSRPDDH